MSIQIPQVGNGFKSGGPPAHYAERSIAGDPGMCNLGCKPACLSAQLRLLEGFLYHAIPGVCAFFIKALLSLDIMVACIAGAYKRRADGIFWNNIQAFLQVPNVSLQPTQVPAKVLVALTIDQPEWTSVV